VEGRLEITGYVTAFIDILGLAHELGQLDRIFEPDVHSDEVLKSARQSLGAILRLRRSIEGFFHGFPEAPKPPGPLDEAQRVIWDRAHSPKLVVQYVSDSVVLSTRIQADNPEGSWVGVHRLFKACAGASAYLLSHGHPCRGGIELGSGCEVAPNEVIGGALASAHALEHKIAVVPRVVVGARLAGVVLSNASGRSSGVSPVERVLAELIRKCLWTDWDDQVIIDFLDPEMLAGIEALAARECIDRVRSVVQAGFFDAVRRDDPDLVKKYAWLDEYVRARTIL